MEQRRHVLLQRDGQQERHLREKEQPRQQPADVWASIPFGHLPSRTIR